MDSLAANQPVGETSGEIVPDKLAALRQGALQRQAARQAEQTPAPEPPVAEAKPEAPLSFIDRIPGMSTEDLIKERALAEEVAPSIDPRERIAAIDAELASREPPTIRESQIVPPGPTPVEPLPVPEAKPAASEAPPPVKETGKQRLVRIRAENRAKEAAVLDAVSKHNGEKVSFTELSKETGLDLTTLSNYTTILWHGGKVVVEGGDVRLAPMPEAQAKGAKRESPASGSEAGAAYNPAQLAVDLYRKYKERDPYWVEAHKDYDWDALAKGLSSPGERLPNTSTLNRSVQMFRDVRKQIEENSKPLTGKKTLIDSANEAAYTKEPTLRAAYKAGDMRLADAIESMQYGSRWKEYEKQMADARKGLAFGSYDDGEALAAYLLARRSATERSDIKNPIYKSTEEARADMQRIEEATGGRVVEAAKQVWKLRTEQVMPLLREEGLLTPDLQAYIEGNENYATYDVQGEFAKRYGNDATAQIFHQVGTEKNIKDPFGAMVSKDQALMRAATMNKAKRESIRFLQENMPDAVSTDSKAYDPRFEKMRYFEPSDPGNIKEAWIPKEWAESLTKRPEQAGLILQSLSTLNAIPRATWITLSPSFQVKNPVRDFKGSVMNLPGGLIQNIIGLSAGYKATYRDVAKYVFQGKASPMIREMINNNELITERMYDAFDSEMRDQGSRATRFAKSLMEDPTAPEAMWKRIAAAVPRTLNKTGRFTEVIGKVAAKDMLQKRGGMSKEEIAHLVRTRAGTPSALAGGTTKPVFNVISMFSNVKLQGQRATFEAARENLPQWAVKQAVMNVAPKALMWAMEAGIAGAVLKSMGQDDDGWMQKVMTAIPESDKQNYDCIPLGLTEKGEAVYIATPTDHVGQTIGTGMWAAFRQTQGINPEELTKAILTQNPMQWSPAVQLSIDAMKYAIGQMPTDAFRGNDLISEKALQAGGKRGLQELGAAEANRVFGGLYRFKGQSRAEIQSEFANMLDTPIIGSTLRSFIRVSNKGITDTMRREAHLEQTEKAATSYDQDTVIRNSVMNLPKAASKADAVRAASTAFRSGRADGTIDPTYKFASYRQRYLNAYQKRFDPLGSLKAAQPGKKNAAKIEARYQQLTAP
jgi:hypothetical protein